MHREIQEVFSHVLRQVLLQSLEVYEFVSKALLVAQMPVYHLNIFLWSCKFSRFKILEVANIFLLVVPQRDICHRIQAMTESIYLVVWRNGHCVGESWGSLVTARTVGTAVDWLRLIVCCHAECVLILVLYRSVPRYSWFHANSPWVHISCTQANSSIPDR